MKKIIDVRGVRHLEICHGVSCSCPHVLRILTSIFCTVVAFSRVVSHVEVQMLQLLIPRRYFSLGFLNILAAGENGSARVEFKVQAG